MAHRVLVTEFIHPAGTEMLRKECEVILPEDISEATMKQVIADVDAVFVRIAPMNRDVINEARKLKVIAKHGVGTDNIDIPAASERGILVCNTPEANGEGVASLAITLMLAVARRLIEVDAFMRTGQPWSRKEELMGYELYGKTLGIVGTGRIGGRLAQICQVAFDMKVYAYDPYVSQEAMAARGITKVETVDELMPLVDFVSVHSPLTPNTKGMIGARQFDLMKESAYLINTSRGPVVDEAALIEALREGKIAGAGLDVFEKEPPEGDNPLAKMSNVVLLPHMGGATFESMERMAIHGAEQILAALRGERPKYLMNPTVLEQKK
jgi:D-3-phosphoglycerate dehydrogenase / 2-oxoglutarate reductase